MIEPQLLSVDQVAQELGCSARTVRRLVQLGHLGRPYRVAGRLTRWSRQQLDVYLARLQARDLDEPEKK